MRKLFIVAVLFLSGCATGSYQVKNEINKSLPLLCQNIRIDDQDTVSDTFAENQKVWKELNSYFQDGRPRKLAVFLDGTCNDKEDSSNIRVLYRLALERACNGEPVIPYYDKGVGAHWFDGIPGGAVGQGASLNIRQAYRFLVNTYRPNDEIYLFGFSRGAFTARSLNGFIEFAGLLNKDTIQEKWTDHLPYWLGSSNIHFVVKNIYEQYTKYDDGTDEFENNLRNDIKQFETSKYPNLQFRPVKLKAIGVFDTVPALGIEADEDPDNHRLGLYANKGVHALSLDEQRNKFRLLRFNPLHVQPNQHLTEVWFPGVHANVGGGYCKSVGCNVNREEESNYYDGLEATSLNWMISKFNSSGDLFYGVKFFKECIDGALHDEFFDSAKLYKKFGVSRRWPREGDTLHDSILQRINLTEVKRPHPYREPRNIYKPTNLRYPITSYYKTEQAPTSPIIQEPVAANLQSSPTRLLKN